MKVNLIAALVVLLFSASSYADLQVTEAVTPSTGVAKPAILNGPVSQRTLIAVGGIVKSTKTDTILQSGKPGEAKVIRGLGKNVSVSEALAQVVPVGWSVYFAGGSMISRVSGGREPVVSWRGGVTWLTVLEDILKQVSFGAMVDWADHEITLFPKPSIPVTGEAGAPATAVGIATASNVVPAPVSAPGVIPAATTGIAVAPGVAPMATGLPPAKVDGAALLSAALLKHTLASKTAPVPAPPAWTLEPALSLAGNIEAWVKREQWTLKWTDPTLDYPIDVAVPFTGRLIGKDGVIAQVIQAYLDADRPLAVEFYAGNKVVEISPLNFSRASK